MAAIELVDLQKLGRVAKDAADALKNLADSIAHIVQLSDSAWSEISARRVHLRLVETYKITQEFGLLQSSRIRRFDEILTALPNIRKADWVAATRTLAPLISAVESILSDIKAERSDFVLEDAYRDLQATLMERRILFIQLQEAEFPQTAEHIAALQAAVDQRKRLRDELNRATDELRKFLARRTAQKS